MLPELTNYQDIQKYLSKLESKIDGGQNTGSTTYQRGISVNSSLNRLIRPTLLWGCKF